MLLAALATFASLQGPAVAAADGAAKKRADAPTHYVSAETAPLFLAWWPGHHEDGFSDSINIDPEGSLFSIGLGISYGHRFSRRFELAGRAEVLRAPPFADAVAHHIRLTTTPYVVFGRGRPYDISVGPRLGFSVLGVADEWVPQFTALAVVRQRVWLHRTVGLQLSVSSGLHPALGSRPKKLELPLMMEFLAVHVGVAARF